MDTEKGILYLCATPIGNLGDITENVVNTLKEADLIAAEDTRNSLKLLNHFAIKTPMTSYHEHNKYDKAKDLLRQLEGGKQIALITDAGTPAISDPGEVLVDLCHEAGIRVTSLPGPCACITALSLSGISARRFCFEGFLPHQKKEREEVLRQLSSEERTIILYEAPHHLCETLRQLYDALGERKMAVCRELTKRYESCIRMELSEAVSHFEANEPKGEFVLVIEGKARSVTQDEKRAEWMKLTLEEHMRYYEEKGFDKKESMKKVAADRGMTKRDVYQQLL